MKLDIISKRYINDGVPLIPLTDNQKKYLKKFLQDKRIVYKPIALCPLCNCKEFILIAQKERYAIPLDTVVCENCGLVRSYKQLTAKSAHLFYSEYYRNIYEGANDDIVEERYSEERVKKITKYVTKDKVVLEIGCGGGWNLIPFHEKGYTYYGFDFDEDFIEYGKTKGLNLYVGGIKEAKKGGIRCDYLFLNHVFEHIANPVNFLKSIKPLLNKNAIVNIYVPSLDLLLFGYGDGDLLGTLQNAHNFLYDEVTLKTAGALAGFKVINFVAMNIVLQLPSSQSSLPPSLLSSHMKRGKKVVKYLNFVEKAFQVRKNAGLEHISFKKLYCLVNPFGCYKKFMMDYLGKI